jgi:UDP-glucose 4-epimerase
MSVLVTGGAGYIGSHMVERLRRARRQVVVIDDLSSGRREAVPSEVPLVVANIADADVVGLVLEKYTVEAVIHFAGRIQVGESLLDPRAYWADNVVATQRLLDQAVEVGVGVFLFSSSAAVYGAADAMPITEDAPTVPINPYGETKLAVEWMLADYARAYGLRFAALRYFNAAGADVDAGLGEQHEPETHLIPLVLDAAAGVRDEVCVFGRDYPTPDGTCIRDYIHVVDLVEAHLAALEHLEAGGASGRFNVGTGRGHSVAEVIDACRRVTGRDIPIVESPRRTGDPPALVASPRLAEEVLRWKPRRSSLERIVRDAWAMHPGRAETVTRRQHEEARANVR